MLSKRSLLGFKRSFALAIASLLSVCLILNSFVFAQSPKNRSNASTNKDNKDKDPVSRNARQPVVNNYGTNGPLVRVALVTDVASVSLSSPTGLAIRSAPSDKKIITTGEILAEVQQPAKPGVIVQTNTAELTNKSATPTPKTSTAITATASAYRVEITSAADSQKAKRIAESVRTRYDQTAAYTYDEQASEYKIVTGAYRSKVQALDMLAILREAGYGKARLVAVQTNHSKVASTITKPTAYKTQPVTKDVTKNVAPNRSLISTPQIAAFQAEKRLASSDKTLIISAERFNDADDYEGNSSYKSAATKNNVSPGQSAKPLLVRVSGKDYRGEIHLKLNERGRLNVINVLPMEEYLRGVVPVELSPSIAQIEALKAQAVAARSYALATLGRFKDEGFDLRDDQRSQVYGGYSVEHQTTNRAVEETRGIVALSFNESGKGSPIEALYTADCGGKTENSENIFSGRAIAYLRSVECAIDKDLAHSQEILSTAKFEQLSEPFGHSLARDVALLSVLGFALSNKVSKDYLDDSVERSELQSWAERTSKLKRENRVSRNDDSRSDSTKADDVSAFDINHEIAVLKSNKRDITKLPAFATLIALSIYGENRESLFMSPAETDYVLAGLGDQDVPRDLRADLALLIKDGILRLPGSGQINARSSITRAHALETFARAIEFKAQVSELKLQTATAIAANKNVLTVAPAKSNTTVRIQPTVVKDSRTLSDTNASRARAVSGQQEIEIEKDARLFKVFGDHRYSVDRLSIVGGERMTYHLNASGRIDFLEVDAANHNSSMNQIADQSRWQERLSADDAQRRLARARIDVGEVQTITPLGFGASRRVVELEIVGSEKTLQLRGQQIRTAFGLKENPLSIERERNAQGNITAFIFNGSGWGHGVGMCQIGAARLAKQGQSYIGILQKYYAGVSVQKIY